MHGCGWDRVGQTESAAAHCGCHSVASRYALAQPERAVVVVSVWAPFGGAQAKKQKQKQKKQFHSLAKVYH